jgi:hypothetical protein
MTLYDFLAKKYPDKDYCQLSLQSDRIKEKLFIARNMENRYKTKKLDSGKLKDKLIALLEILEAMKYPITKDIIEVKDILENEDLRHYAQYNNYKFSYSDSFYQIYNFYYDDDYLSQVKQFKRWTLNRKIKISNLLRAFIQKKNNRLIAMKYFSTIKKYKSLKKYNFIVSFDYVGACMCLDFAVSHKEKIYLIINDTSKQNVIKRLRKYDKASELVQYLISKDNCWGSIENIEFLKNTPENLKLAKDCYKKRYRKYTTTYCKKEMINARM